MDICISTNIQCAMCARICAWVFVLTVNLLYLDFCYLAEGISESSPRAKSQIWQRIGFVANRLPVGALDEPITPICVIFRCASFW